MKYKIFKSEHFKSWAYTGRKGDKKGLNFECGYDHRKQEVHYFVHGSNPHGTNYGVRCVYSDFIAKKGRYNSIKESIIKDFSKNLFTKIEKVILSKPITAELKGGGRPKNTSSVDKENKEPEKITKTKVEKVKPIYSTPKNDPVSKKIDKIPDYQIQNKTDWTSKIESLQKFDLKAIRRAKLSSIPTFVKVIIYPFMFFCGIAGVLSVVSFFIWQGRLMNLVIGVILIVITYLVVFGIASYWEKLNGRTAGDNYLIKGKSLKKTLESFLGNKSIITPGIDAESMMLHFKKVYKKELKLMREHIYTGDNFKVIYAETFINKGSRNVTKIQSVFLLETPNKNKEVYRENTPISKWFLDNYGVDTKKYLNTKGFYLMVKDEFVIIIFQDLLFKAEDIFHVFMSLTLMMHEATQRELRK